MTLVQIAKDGPTGSIRKMWNWVDILPWMKREGFLVTSGSRPLELELEKEMSIEKHWKQMYLVYIAIL
jgi:hypothetical protein